MRRIISPSTSCLALRSFCLIPPALLPDQPKSGFSLGISHDHSSQIPRLSLSLRHSCRPKLAQNQIFFLDRKRPPEVRAPSIEPRHVLLASISPPIPGTNHLSSLQRDPRIGCQFLEATTTTDIALVVKDCVVCSFLMIMDLSTLIHFGTPDRSPRLGMFQIPRCLLRWSSEDCRGVLRFLGSCFSSLATGGAEEEAVGPCGLR